MQHQQVLSGKSDVPQAVLVRVRELVSSIEHAVKINATTKLERSKNELRSIVKTYGIQVMQGVYLERGFKIDSL